VFILVCLALIRIADSWGVMGHKVVAWMAEKQLTPRARQFVTTQLLKDESLQSISTWADEIAYNAGMEWTQKLHFVNSHSRGDCSFDDNRDCADGMCLTTAITNFTSRLGSRLLSFAERNQALKYLVHFVADIHQPLHCGFVSDRGGNSLHVTSNFTSTRALHTPSSNFKGVGNLHWMWDSHILLHWSHELNTSWEGVAQEIDLSINTFSPGRTAQWASSCKRNSFRDTLTCPRLIAAESVKAACSTAYVNKANSDIHDKEVLNRDYYHSAIELIRVQLAKASYRLSSILNDLADFEDGPQKRKASSDGGRPPVKQRTSGSYLIL